METNAVKITPDELSNWIKDPRNIFAGTTKEYSNVFSYAETDPSILVTTMLITNYTSIENKTVGYITPNQHKFANILVKIKSCKDLIEKYVKTIPVQNVFSDTINRIHLAFAIKNIFNELTLEVGKQCLTQNELLKVIKINKMIGHGTFGTVYTATVGGKYEIALKMAISEVTKLAISNPYSYKYNAWSEVNILRPYLNSLIEKGICQNVPYVYDTFICNMCDFERPDKGILKNFIKKHPCYMIAIELASGDLLNWASVGRNVEAKYNALFQAMAGIHAIQKYFQISNNDIKDKNILFKNVPAGGCWEYVIRGRSYYIPNNGSVFMINDFGVSNCFDPTLPICGKFRELSGNGKKVNVDHNVPFAGNRPYIIVDNAISVIKYKNIERKRAHDIYLLFNTNFFSQAVYIGLNINMNLTPSQSKILEKETGTSDPSNKTMYTNAELLPFMESYIDVQDLIKTFIGGRRMSQPGNHTGIAKELNSELGKYIFENTLLQHNDISKLDFFPARILAGYFIEHFFGSKKIYDAPSGPIIQRFVI